MTRMTRGCYGGILGLLVGLTGGCGTFSADNVAGRPWDRPTRPEVSPYSEGLWYSPSSGYATPAHDPISGPRPGDYWP